MQLKAIIDDHLYELHVPEAFLAEAAGFFDQMDRDMDQGWQMSREWVDHPDREQRCRIVADKLLTALEKKSDRLGRLMAGYLLSRMPEIDAIEIDTTGEIQNTRLTLRGPTPTPTVPSATAQPTAGMDRVAAMEQAGNDVTKIFKVGHAWRFSVYDHATGQWQDSAAAADKEEAERLRQEALRRRFAEILGGAPPSP
jgi:hypothetical protein